MRAFPGKHAYVTAHFILKKQRPQLVAHKASQCLFARKRFELLRINSRVFCQPRESNFEDFEVQTILSFEMIIDRGLVDPSLGDDVSHARSLEALLRKQRDGGFDDQVAGIFSGTGHWSP